MKSTVVVCCVLLATISANELHKENIDFTANFFQQVVKLKPNSSVIMSAYSVLTPLAQLSVAAEGDTQKELLESLALPSIDAVKTTFKDAYKNIMSVQGVTLKTASKIYVALNTTLKKEFNDVSKEIFNTEVESVDFKDTKNTALAINHWVESQTNNRIKDLVSPDTMNELTRAVLVNAIYFKGKWLNAFNENLTQKRDFYVNKDKKIDVSMMSQKNHFLYGQSSELKSKLLEMPYEKKEASFVAILPDDIDGISALEEKLKNPSVLTRAKDLMHSTEVNVHLPKFKIETSIDLKEVLTDIGVKQIFSEEEANLTNLIASNETLHISAAIQKAFIEVNEEGAEAAAANAFHFSLMTPMLQIPPKEFNANHPFVFGIKVHNEFIFSGVFKNSLIN